MKIHTWEKRGFEEFMKGTLGNGGQNLYVSAKGVLQRIHQYDLTGNGYVDLLFANSHSMSERPPLHLYNNPFEKEFTELYTRGSFDACMADITGDGKMDLIVACQHDGVVSDTTATIFFSSERGYSEKYKTELVAPAATAVCAGDFRGIGKNDIIFVGGGKLRVFEQGKLGIESNAFFDVPSDAISAVSSDFDDDGYEDLYVLTQSGKLKIYWGSDKGISIDNFTELDCKVEIHEEMETTTAGRIHMRWLPWVASVIDVGGKKCIFRSDMGDAVFEYFDKDRNITTFKRIKNINAVYATSGAVTQKGSEDIIILCQNDRDKIEDSYLLLQKDNYDIEKAIKFKTNAARSATISPLFDGGRSYVFVAQTSTRKNHENDCQVLLFDESGNIEEKHDVKGLCCGRICVGDSGKKENYQVVFINHEGMRPDGDEEIYFYLGDKDGYMPERKITFPAMAAVEGAMIDFTDNGHPDVMVVNCGENAPHLCEGIYIYHNDGNGPDKNKCEKIPMILPHGAAIGDFRKCGYLDIVTGGIKNREIRIYRGGPEGYSDDNVQKIVFGPNPESFTPFPWDIEDKDPDYSDEECKILTNFGGLRWLYAADFNGDGYLDLFISQITGKNCFILWGGKDGFSTENMQSLATAGAGCANVADLDGDGYPDLILGSHIIPGKKEIRESYITIYWGSGEGFSENRKTCLPAWCVNSIAIGDFNNDGILDIYATSYSNSRIRDIDSFIYYGSKDGTFSVKNKMLIRNNSGCGCLAGDFNGDGYTDLAVASHKKEGNHECDSYVYWGGPDGIKETNRTALPTIGCHGMTTVDIGNVMDRSDGEFYYSETYETPEISKVLSASWSTTIPETCEVIMHIISADSPDDLVKKQWNCSVKNGEDISNKNIQGKFFRYRLTLRAKNGCGTPRIDSVYVNFG